MSTLEKLTITDTRNLVSVAFAPSPSVNILYGVNGSGKTSLLEAIHLLGTARSFRTPKIKSVIRQGESSCVVFGRVKDDGRPRALGIVRAQDGSCKIHIDGQSARQSSELAALLPLQVINANTFRLLEGSPKDRRQFLDWGVFHVEHRFLQAWKRCQKAMKQRNALLRNGGPRHGKIDPSLLDIWNQELVQSGEEIDRYRAAYFERLLPVFEHTLAQLSALTDIRITYTRGWDKETSLAEVLERSLSRELEAGYTLWGPHRADIRIRHGSALAVESLSRGQQKTVICALKLAQGKLFSDIQAHGCVYLVDDLPAELDRDHRLKLCSMLEALKAQVFLTCVESKSLANAWSSITEVKMFHVEHGSIHDDNGKVLAEALST